MRQKIADEVSNKVDQVSSKVNESLARIKSRPLQKNKNDAIDIYESDFFEALLSDDNDNNIDEKDDKIDEEQEHEEEEESFNDLIKEIDTDAFTVAMGGIFTEIVIYAITGIYVQLDEDEGSDDEKGSDSLEDNAAILTLGFFIVGISVLILFTIISQIISTIQMRRDRILYKMFVQLQNRSENSNVDLKMKIGEYTIDENCCIAGCIKFSYKSYKLTEHIISFGIGFLGWSFGWATASALYATDEIMIRFYYSLVATGFGILFYFYRSRRLKKKYENWKRLAREHRMEQQQQQQQMENEENNEEKSNIEHEYDMITMKANHHQKLYVISNVNLFFRKAYGLMVALPWELTFELGMEKSMENVTHEVLTRVAVSIVATIVFSYCGIQFINIQSDVHHHSTSHATSKLLKGNYMKLKKFV